jgi:hypothetical protein
MDALFNRKVAQRQAMHLTEVDAAVLDEMKA